MGELPFALAPEAALGAWLREAEREMEPHRTAGTYRGFDGTELPWQAVHADRPRAHVVLLHGFTEFPEKYRELCRYLRQAGCTVWLPVLRGHGQGGIVHVDRFEDYVRDIACFLRDIAGALGMHSSANVQYIRPEIIGIVVGAAAAALAAREFRAKAGASPACRFVLGMFVMIGALVFLGCPLRMVIRLGGGDLTAVAGLVGFIAGILVGVVCLKKGFSLGRAYPVRMGEGFVLSGILMALLGLLLLVPTLLKFSEAGPGSMRAFWGISLAAGLVVGVLAQRSRLCMAGGIRDAVMLRDFKLLSGFLAIWGTVTIGNLVLGSYSLSALSQPIAHSQYLWSALGMALAGWGSILLGGCPLRQLILAGEGNGDSAVTVLGMIVGAAVSHNFGLAGAADSVAEDGTYVVGGIGTAGMAAVAIGFAVLLAITVTHLPKTEAVSRD